MSYRRDRPGDWVDDGRTKLAACRWCEGPIPPKGRRRTFCSADCVHQYKVRTDSGYRRQKVFERDNGICGLCGVDCLGYENQLAALPWHSEPGKEQRARERARRMAGMKRRARGTGHLWQADHITPVSEGGGECDLDNLRTLCTACHKAETAKLRKRLASQ